MYNGKIAQFNTDRNPALSGCAQQGLVSVADSDTSEQALTTSKNID
jgi:hypothetical protein